MTAQHAPGPYYWQNGYIDTIEGQHIAKMLLTDRTTVAAIDESIATTTLLTAAPELLFALGCARAAIQSADPTNQQFPETLRVVDAAIAKATGGKP